MDMCGARKLPPWLDDVRKTAARRFAVRPYRTQDRGTDRPLKFGAKGWLEIAGLEIAAAP
jgi:hypothetical protein